MIKRGIVFFAFVFTLLVFPLGVFAAERYEILKIGDEDKYVTQLQDKLRELGYFDTTSTGYFGTITQQAVINYQKDSGLAADGKAGPETLKSLMGESYKIPSDRFVVNDAVVIGTYYPGDKGEEIRNLQQTLKALEYYEYTEATGYYGPVTTAAVQRFQRTNGLKEDGIAGPETISLLYSGSAKYFCIYPGDRGADIESLQLRLKELGYYTYGKITGYFGTVTTEALKEFQKQNGLAVDGIAGKITRGVLYSDGAKPFDASVQSKPEASSTPEPQISPDEKMLSFANEQLGKPYVYSTEGPGSFDCSGLVYYVLKYMGVSTSRYSAAGFSNMKSWQQVSWNELKPGDLLFFKSDASLAVSHTGVFIGGNSFIHASSGAGCVKISELTSYYQRNFVLARRVFQ